MRASGSSRKSENRLFTAADVRARQKNAGIVGLRRPVLVNRLTQPWRQLRRKVSANFCDDPLVFERLQAHLKICGEYQTVGTCDAERTTKRRAHNEASP